jgi:hypothetical protein
VEISKKNEIPMQVPIFGRDGLLHLYYHFRCPGIFRGWNDPGSGQAIFLIGKKTAFSRSRLNEHLVPPPYQGPDQAGSQAYSIFVILCFFRKANQHFFRVMSISLVERTDGYFFHKYT